MAEPTDALSEHMANYEKDRSYRTIELLGEHATQRTERVISTQGRLCVRKYLPLDETNLSLFRELQNIRNPHLAQVVDCYELGSNLVLVTEYVEGVPLASFVETLGPLTPAQAERLMTDVTDALQALHEVAAGPIVHRDVKPNNIIVTQRGAVLIDFDIARRWNESREQDTRIWGTSGYAAPEQFGFQQTDARTDVYALGVVLRFMLTGQEPQEKASLAEGPIKKLIESSMSLDPADRPQSVREFQQQLSRAVVRLGNQAKKVVVLPKEPEPRSAPLTLRHALWRAWQIVATLVGGILLVCCLVIITGIAPLSADSTVTSNTYIPFMVFWVVLPWLLLCDGFGVLEQIPWFKQNRLLKVLGLTFVSLVVGLALALVVQGAHGFMGV